MILTLTITQKDSQGLETVQVHSPSSYDIGKQVTKSMHFQDVRGGGVIA